MFKWFQILFKARKMVTGYTQRKGISSENGLQCLAATSKSANQKILNDRVGVGVVNARSMITRVDMSRSAVLLLPVPTWKLRIGAA
jgi:hypothetical protein